MIKRPLKLIGYFAAGKDLPPRDVQYSAYSFEVEDTVSAPSTLLAYQGSSSLQRVRQTPQPQSVARALA